MSNTIPYISIYNYNFGDALNEPILRALSSNRKDFVFYRKVTSEEKRLSAIGSIAFLWTGNTVVWGSGVLSERETCPPNLNGMEFRCVRGPKTRQHLMNKGYKDIPEIYCDPGVLAPYFYRNILSDEKKFDIGIFPHNTDNPEWYRKVCFPDTNVMMLSYNDPIDITLRRMSACKRIISSSLHGIITAEAMGIPVSWYRLTDDNDDFKFHDYFEGTGRKDVIVNDIRGYHPLSVDFVNMDIIDEKPIFDMRGLLESCPFEIEDKLKKDILDYYSENSIIIS